MTLDQLHIGASAVITAVGGDGALLWTEHRARRAQRFFRCSA